MSQVQAFTARTPEGGLEGTLHNNLAFWALCAFVLLVPIPFASSQAYFWGVAAIYIGITTVIYAAFLFQAGARLRFSAKRIWLSSAAFFVFCLALVIQLIPFGTVGIVTTPDLTLEGIRLSIAPGMTWLMLMRQAMYGIFFFLMLQVLTNDHRRVVFLNILIFGIAAYAAYALVSLRAGDTILGLPKWAYLGVATGTFVNRNSFATFLAIGAAVATVRIGSIIVAHSRHNPDDGSPHETLGSLLLLLLALVAIVLALFETESRMGIAAAAAGCAIGTLLILTRAGNKRPILAVALVIPILGILGFWLFGERLFDRLVTVDGAAESRMSVYAQILELIAMRPLTGFGGGSFELAFPLVQHAPVDTFFTWDRGHNTYLTLWSEMGLFAGSIPMLIIAVLGARVAIRFRHSRSNANITAQAAALAAIVVVAIHSLVDFSLEIPANAVLFLAVLAAGVATLARPGPRT